VAKLSETELTRYNRQNIIEGFGIEGQQKLKNASVFIAGAGGLGGIIAIYLALAGIGKIGLVDGDIVELSNLNRQILYNESDIGRKKVAVAVPKVKTMNPQVQVIGYDDSITDNNAFEMTAGFNLLIDALDNFETRYILNRVAIRRNIPFFHGAVRGFEGRVATIIPGKTACLRCIYPEAPPPVVNPVLGVTPAVVGGLQATEVIKFLTGLGKLSTDRLMVYDGLSLEFIQVNTRRNPDCPDCQSSR
jgi:molybdopterin/thiamine biosynthesis adenylyltransferase